MSTARRVRRVRLAAPRDDLVRRGALLLEDALRTASVPVGDGGRLVLVRSLDVGRIRAGAAPSSLALAIEARLREAESVAVHAADANDDAPAVFFRDAGEAAALLCVRLARGGEAGAWFWRAAVPGWTPALGPAEGIRLALRAAADSAPGAAAVAHVLHVALERGALDRVLATVDGDTAAGLVARAGWSVPRLASIRPADGPEDAPAVAREWRATVERWIAAWGGEDVRSAWLAATALVADRPTRAADPHLPHRAQQIVAATIRPLYPLSAESADRPSSTEKRRTSEDDHHRPPISSRDADPGAVDGDRSASPDLPSATEITDAVDPDHPEIVNASWIEGDIDPDHPAPMADSSRGIDPLIAADPAAKLYDSDSADAIHLANDRPSSAADPRPADPRSADPPRDADRPIAGEAAPMTGAAGLFFLISALEWLGMGECVAHHPALLEADLPARVLLRVAERLRVPPDDAAVRALATGELDSLYAGAAGELDELYAFAAPAAWTRTVLRPSAEVVRATGDGDPRFDASGRLLIGSGSSTLGMIVDAWVTALRRWCRRYGRMGLRALVLRRGRIASTRTHVDVTMPLAAAEVRVRVAGLDLDPGWVPWLGRVVAFHYED